MCFINDIDFIDTRRWGEFDVLPQVANGINAAVGGGIHFNDIKGFSLRDVSAEFAGVARFGCRHLVKFRFLKAVWAVDGFGKDACDGGFAGASRPPEKVCVPDALREDLIL